MDPFFPREWSIHIAPHVGKTWRIVHGFSMDGDLSESILYTILYSMQSRQVPIALHHYMFHGHWAQECPMANQRPGRLGHDGPCVFSGLATLASRQVSFTCPSMWDASPSLRHSFESARDTKESPFCSFCSLQLESPSVSCLKFVWNPWPHGQRLWCFSLYILYITVYNCKVPCNQGFVVHLGFWFNANNDVMKQEQSFAARFVLTCYTTTSFYIVQWIYFKMYWCMKTIYIKLET